MMSKKKKHSDHSPSTGRVEFTSDIPWLTDRELAAAPESLSAVEENLRAIGKKKKQGKGIFEADLPDGDPSPSTGRVEFTSDIPWLTDRELAAAPESSSAVEENLRAIGKKKKQGEGIFEVDLPDGDPSPHGMGRGRNFVDEGDSKPSAQRRPRDVEHVDNDVFFNQELDVADNDMASERSNSSFAAVERGEHSVRPGAVHIPGPGGQDQVEVSAWQQSIQGDFPDPVIESNTPEIPDAYLVEETVDGNAREPVEGKVVAVKKRRIIVGLLFILTVLAVGLGVGLGVGLTAGSDGKGEVESESPTFREILEPISGSDLNNTNTSQYQAMEWISSKDGRMLSPESEEVVERYILAVLYFSTNGSSWREKLNFLGTSSVCDWRHQTSLLGVTCEEDGSVSGLNLGANSLQGATPAELGYLSRLTSLNLPGNSLSASLPTTFGQLTNLEELELFSNSITGKIPSQLGMLFKLKELYLQDNSFSGYIPSELGNLKDLRDLSLGGNCLSGTVPRDFGRLSSLNNLYLYANSLSGTIPSELGNLSALQNLHLFGNNIEGDLTSVFCDRGYQIGNFWWDCRVDEYHYGEDYVPDPLCECCTECCDVATCNKQGLCSQVCVDNVVGSSSHTEEYRKCSRLGAFQKLVEPISGSAVYDSNTSQYQALSWLAREDERMISPESAELVERYVVSMLYFSTNGSSWYDRFNFLEGGSVCEWNKAQESMGVSCFHDGSVAQLKLDHNSLKGTIPIELGDLRLISLDLQDNALSGSIPTEIASLTNLEFLGLAFNNLNGQLLSEMGKLNKMVTFSASANSLTGPIPTELGLMTDVERLYLYDNSLVGRIPSDLGNLVNLQFLEIDANGLSGWLPSELGHLTNLETLGMYRNGLAGMIPTELGNLGKLTDVRLSDNILSSSLPSELGKLGKLTNLQLWGNSLSSSIPSELGNLSKLEWLALSLNCLTGTVPSELGNLSGLRFLELILNDLSGTIPAEMGNLSNLEVIWIMANRIEGNLTDVFCGKGFQIDEFLADCLGTSPRVLCDCCTRCSAGQTCIEGVCGIEACNVEGNCSTVELKEPQCSVNNL